MPAPPRPPPIVVDLTDQGPGPPEAPRGISTNNTFVYPRVGEHLGTLHLQGKTKEGLTGAKPDKSYAEMQAGTALTHFNRTVAANKNDRPLQKEAGADSRSTGRGAQYKKAALQAGTALTHINRTVAANMNGRPLQKEAGAIPGQLGEGPSTRRPASAEGGAEKGCGTDTGRADDG